MKSQVGFVSSLLLMSGIASAHEYNGTVSGFATVLIDGDPLAIEGMTVELYKKTEPLPMMLATGATGAGGAFALEYEDEDPTETIELYLNFVAQTEDGMIRVRARDVLGKHTRFETLFQDDPIIVEPNEEDEESVITDLGEISLDRNEAKPQLLHWANRARKFVTDELGEGPSPLPHDDPSKPLDIMDSPIPGDKDGGFFIPALWHDELIPAAVAILTVLTGAPPGPLLIAAFALIVNDEMSDQDCIYLAKTVDAQTSDDGVYHEFGHYFMWHAQEGDWLNPLEASFANHSVEWNAANPKIAWTEGWADAFGSMVDSWSAADDGEGANDDTRNVDDEGAERLILCNGGGSGCSQQAVTHGFWSEHFIASALYDLWDAPNDDGGEDVIELSFAELAGPILGSKGDVVSDIVDYHNRLIDLDLPAAAELSEQRALDRALTELFTLEDGPNKVRNLSTDLASPAHAFGDLLNTDAISFSREIEVQTFKEKDDDTLKEANKDEATFTVDVPVLSGPDDTFNVSSMGSGDFEEVLLDDLTITGTMGIGAAQLHINFRERRGWQSGSNSYGVPTAAFVAGERNFAVTLAGNMDVEVIDQGQILIGQDSTHRTADVTLEAGATLTLGGGPGGANPSPEFPGGPLVSKGMLYIDDDSSLVIERDATLVIKRGAEIVVDGSELIIRGDLVVEDGATFQWTAINGGMVTFDLPDLAGEPNVIMAKNSTIKIHETAFTIAPFSYVRPTPSDATGPRTIIIEHGSIGYFDEEAYLDTTGTFLTLTDSTIEANDGDKHKGVRLDNNLHLIEGMTFTGGTLCIEELGSAAGAGDPLTISDSTFGGCTTAIQVDNRSLVLDLVTIDDGTTGVAAFGVADVTVGFSEITQQTEHGLRMEQSASAAVIESTFRWNNVGIEITDGAGLRLEDATITQNSVGVRATDGATVNAGYVGSVGSFTHFDRNSVGIQLQDAGFPVLAGDNAFSEASGVGVRSISGTVDDGGACGAATIIVDADVWNDKVGAVWNTVSLTFSPYSITSNAGGCGFTYTLVQ